MTVARPSPDDTPALWPFACALYAAPGVSEAAIMLQDRHAVDVNILLFACWVAGREGGVLAGGEMEAAIDATASLQAGTIRPLRAERRAIPKGGAREAERRQLLDLELAAEKTELGLLEGLRPRPGAPLAGPAAIEAAAMANMRLYLAHRGVDPDEAVMAPLHLLARFTVDIHTVRAREI